MNQDVIALFVVALVFGLASIHLNLKAGSWWIKFVSLWLVVAGFALATACVVVLARGVLA